MKIHGPYAVHLHKDGTLHSFMPGDEVPEWAAAKIDRHALRDEGLEDRTVVRSSSPSEVPAGTPDVPPKAGPAASRQVWVDFAESKGVAVRDDWKRDDIVAAVEQAGLA